MSNAAAPEDVEKLSFEDALDELERITAEMAPAMPRWIRASRVMSAARSCLSAAEQSSIAPVSRSERIRVEDGEVKRQTSDASASEAPIPSADTLNEDDLPF